MKGRIKKILTIELQSCRLDQTLKTALNAEKWKFATWKLLIFGCNNLHMRISSGQQAMIIKQLHIYKVHSWHSIRPSRKCTAAHWKVKFDCSSSLQKHISIKHWEKMWNSQAPQSLSLQQLKLPNGYTKKTESTKKKRLFLLLNKSERLRNDDDLGEKDITKI